LRSRSEHIEHLKLMIENLRHRIFGTKSEKTVLRLEQFELELEDMETTQAEAESAIERVSPAQGPKARAERKPLPDLERDKRLRWVGCCCVRSYLRQGFPYARGAPFLPTHIGQSLYQ
jgi:hypothetical protein